MATAQTPSGRRKRSRPDDEPDSSPAVTPSMTAAVKRRRLNNFSTQSPSTPKGFSAITSAIGNALGLGRRGGPKPDSRSDHATSTNDDVYDIPEPSSNKKPTKSLQDLPIKHKKLGLPPPKTNQRPSRNVYDVPDSDDEIQGGQEKTNTSQDELQATPTGRKGIKAISSTSSKKSVSARLLESRKKKAAPPAQSEPDQDTPKRRSRTASKKLDQQNVPTLAAKFLATEVLTRSPDPGIKGILSPRKKKPGRPRKNVAFTEEDSGKENDVFFEDISTKPKPGTQEKTSGTINDVTLPSADEENEEQDDEDDEVCAICSKPDSEPPNEIIFCENCDMAVHQKCYDVPVIPEGDWICRNCSQDDVLSGPKPTPKKQIRATKVFEIPNIPNFEQHLRHMQRVLLDRCTGARRIKLCGQDEAYDKAFQLVEQTVLAGEGNSMMVIGARGCGKTTLMEEIISNLRAEHQEEFHVVRLNGFIHTDDKLALKEIWRQLGKEMDLEDDLVNKVLFIINGLRIVD